MDRVGLIGINDYLLSSFQRIFILIYKKIQAPLHHSKNLYRRMPVLLTHIIAISSFKKKNLKRKSLIRNDQDVYKRQYMICVQTILQAGRFSRLFFSFWYEIHCSVFQVPHIVQWHALLHVWICPVSYTHLDVYKRQSITFTPTFFGILLIFLSLYLLFDCNIWKHFCEAKKQA